MEIAITKEKQIEILNGYLDRARMECLGAIELGLPWSVVQAVKDKDNPEYNSVITLKYQCPAHLLTIEECQK